MLFNSIDFAIFLPIVFCLYRALNKRLKWQNVCIVAASYVFYGWWDYRFLALIFFSTVTDYVIGIGISRENRPDKRKWLLWVSMIVNIGFLGFFKYYNFFLDNLITAYSFCGMELKAQSLNIILPVGISFYTFQTMSYTIDVYKRKLEATTDFIAFAAFVSFFPQLVAGPIERATNLLPQFYTKRTFDYSQAVDGMRQILWGLVKKLMIADNCAKFANLIFEQTDSSSGSVRVLGAVFFTFQIYGDFSGYSDIAIGTARLFGFRLMKNFSFPYFSRDMAEFWRRWHISLSTWFRDYLYIPLGGSRGNLWMRIRNTMIIFLVSGLWHGADWTFIVWGGLNAVYFLPLLLTNNNRKNLQIVAAGKYVPTVKEFFSMLATFGLTVFAWIFFRADSMGHAVRYISGIFSSSLFTIPLFPKRNLEALTTLLLVFVFLLVEWIGREGNYAIERIGLTWSRPARWAFYFLIVFLIIMFLPLKESPFIYFQF
ncbi:MAG: MBOAT family protein [Tannerella sp.]|jgi:D-alanyl-lipoteichoic acid acyltransferase DltB (MBOAT superfamily)|nr:MBOAT family protein [Tannerella sp.]